MGASGLALALVVLVSGQPVEEPQLLVLPLDTDGVKAQLGLDAWKAVVAEVAKAKTKLKIGVSLQKQLHDMLLGPVREQARDCGGNIDCLCVDIGRPLDVAQLIAGKVTQDEVTLFAVEISTGQRLGSGKSPANLAKAKVEAKAKAAAQSLIAAMLKTKKPGGAAVVASNDATKDQKGGKTATKDPPKDPPKDNTPDPTPEINDKPQDNSNATTTSNNNNNNNTTASNNNNNTTSNNANTTSSNTTSSSNNTASNNDPTKLPPQNNTTNSNVTRTEQPRPQKDDSVTDKWWFWTAIAAAVVAGGATTVVLAGGTKGGPSVPSNTGTVFGTY